MVFGSDPTNYFGIDIERLQLTYRANPYFQLTGGRFHTAIGYYNTAYHHGTWFQTATGRPFMYDFEDSGGILPVHSVGASAEGDVRGAEKIGLHWIAEMSNGRSSAALGEPVQNFLSDKNHKAFNFRRLRPAASCSRPTDRGLLLSRSDDSDRRAAGDPTDCQCLRRLHHAIVRILE
jgi:hypothetical protein